jgi:hypothetical protein
MTDQLPVPEPDAKHRRTGEVNHTSASYNSTVRQMNSTGRLMQSRQPNQLSASTNSRPQYPRPSSRINSNNHSSQYGQNRISQQPAAQQHYRSQSAMGHSRSRSQGTALRTTKQMQQDQFEPVQPMGPPTGRQAFFVSSNVHDGLKIAKPLFQRYRSLPLKNVSAFNHVSSRAASAMAEVRCHPSSEISSAPRSSTSQDCSLNTAMEKMSIRQLPIRPANNLEGLQETFSVSYLQPSKISTAEKLSSTPETPCKLPIPIPRKSPVTLKKPGAVLHFAASLMSPTKRAGGATSPSKPVFLSKDSNLTSTAWENDNSVATRLASMETFYEHMKSQMEGTSFQQSSMKEMIEMMKQRSKLFKNSHISKK